MLDYLNYATVAIAALVICIPALIAVVRARRAQRRRPTRKLAKLTTEEITETKDTKAKPVDPRNLAKSIPRDPQTSIDPRSATKEESKGRDHAMLSNIESYRDSISGYNVSGSFHSVDIHFGTDRSFDLRFDTPEFTSLRSHELTLGKARVTIPKERHRVGYLEQPWSFSLGGITIFKRDIDPKKHFTLQSTIILNEKEFRESIMLASIQPRYRSREAFIFIHGFNTDFQTALFRAAQLAYDTNFDGVSLIYSWPSGSKLRDYVYDLNSIESATTHLRRFLALVLSVDFIEKVHVVAHSMGSKALSLAISGAPRSLRRKFSELVLASPDIDQDVFQTKTDAIRKAARGRTLYVSHSDKALTASSLLAGGVPRVGKGKASGVPIIAKGFDTIDTSAVGLDFFSANHSGYVESPLVLNDIGALLRTGTRPPHLRSPVLRQMTVRQGTYWAFPK